MHSCGVVAGCTSELPAQVQPWHACPLKSPAAATQSVMASAILSAFTMPAHEASVIADASLRRREGPWGYLQNNRDREGVVPPRSFPFRLASCPQLTLVSAIMLAHTRYMRIRLCRGVIADGHVGARLRGDGGDMPVHTGRLHQLADALHRGLPADESFTGAYRIPTDIRIRAGDLGHKTGKR
jgi:hypothetical protein